MKEGWDASGRLEAIWNEFPGRRDEMAARTGIGKSTLSAYNSGARQLGMRNAMRIAQALEISIYDLGAPRLRAEDFAATMFGQLVEHLIRGSIYADPERLLELADETERLSAALRATALARGDGQLLSR